MSLKGVVTAVKKARKFIGLALLAAVVCSALPAMAAVRPMAVNPDRIINLGLDHVNMQWWILDYGTRDDGTHFSIARRYFTNESIRQDIVGILVSRFGHPREVADTLFFSEFMFVYTPDGSQFATEYLWHFDMLGNAIHGTVWDNSCADTMLTFAPVVPAHASGRAIARILGR